MPTPRTALNTPYGHFSDDGQSFVIPRPDVPHPLVNVASTGTYGVAVAQTGAGCSWGRRPSEPVTKGSGDFTRDAGGRALYLRDEKTGRFWSVGWQPVRAKPDQYECVHGVGYTLITSQTAGLQAQWLTFVPNEEPLEVWRVRIRNLSKQPRSVSLWTGIEWASQRAQGGDDKSFVQDENRILLAKARPSTSGGRGGIFFHGVNLPTRAFALDRRALWGLYGSPEGPEALNKGRYLAGAGAPGREPFASLCVPFTLKPGEERSVLFSIGCAEAQSEALLKARKFQDFAQVDNAWNRTQMFWDRYLSGFTIETPDAGFNLLTNTWLKYQALSQGFWGGRGFRDARIFLPVEPSRVRQEVLARAAGTKPLFAPFSDVPWPELLVDYLKETGEGRLLSEKVGARSTLYDLALKGAREMSALPMEEAPWVADFLEDFAAMSLWAARHDHVPAARAQETAKRLKLEVVRRRAAPGKNGHREVSIRALEEACRRGRSAASWEIYRNLAPLPPRDSAALLFSTDAPERGEPPAAALFKACTEGILGLKPDWDGLRVRPCLPPGWKSASARREFRGALYTFRVKRSPARPSGFLALTLNGNKVAGDLLPVMFGRKNEVSVTVGRAG